MKTTIDRAGRLVVPKAVREAVGLLPGSTVEIEVREGAAVLMPSRRTAKLVRRGKGLVLVPDGKVPTLTAAKVREMLESLRR